MERIRSVSVGWLAGCERDKAEGAGQTRWCTEDAIFVSVDRKRADDVADGIVSGKGVGIVVEFDGVYVGVPAARDVGGHDGLSVV